VAVQFFASRGALLGVPAADDYDYLYWLKFHPFTLFDSMGSLDYWRPVGRQLYYAAVAPFLFRAPWLVGLLHGVLLLLVFALLFRVARRGFPAPVAASIAAFPILAEPLRALLVWPTGGEYLLALVFTSLAIHEVFHERPLTCALALLAALASHEASGLALVAVPVIAWRRRGSRADALRWGAWMAGVVLVWFAGHELAHARGAGWLAAGSAASLPSRLALAFSRSAVAQLNLEDAPPVVVLVVSMAYVALGAAAAWMLFRDRSARDRVGRHAAPILGAVAWFAAGVAALSLLLPDWNAWRTALPGLWLGFAVAGFLGAARPALAVALLAVRLVSLVIVTPAPSYMVGQSPQTTSKSSFQRVARFQRAAEGVRHELMRRFPTLPPGTSVRYWSRPRGTAISLVGSKAIGVWYGDSTLTWEWAWGPDEVLLPGHNPVLAFEHNDRVAVVLEPAAIDLAREGNRAMRENRWLVADSLFELVLRAQAADPSDQFAGWAVKCQMAIALTLEQYERAESLNAVYKGHVGDTGAYYGFDAVFALHHGDATRAARSAALCLEAEPQNEFALMVLRSLRSGPVTAPSR
jgi:hypothetical protein